MARTIMGAAAVSLDGFIADVDDGIGPMFDWLGNGDVEWTWTEGQRGRAAHHAGVRGLRPGRVPADRRAW